MPICVLLPRFKPVSQRPRLKPVLVPALRSIIAAFAALLCMIACVALALQFGMLANLQLPLGCASPALWLKFNFRLNLCKGYYHVSVACATVFGFCRSTCRWRSACIHEVHAHIERSLRTCIHQIMRCCYSMLRRRAPRGPLELTDHSLSTHWMPFNTVALCQWPCQPQSRICGRSVLEDFCEILFSQKCKDA